MKIVNLIENAEGSTGCACVHGLSFYVETKQHKLLVDLAPSEDTLRNAEKLGINLTQVDTVILSHGHYDHSGGIMAFTKINPDAVIYMQESAGDDYYADDGESSDKECYRYIGIDHIGTRYCYVSLWDSVLCPNDLRTLSVYFGNVVPDWQESSEYFEWVKLQLSTTLPKGKTAEGLNYSVNQEQYLRVFLEGGEVPIDNSACERALRTFCVGKKNWLFFDSERGAEARARVFSIAETAKLNGLRPYYYFEYILTELPKLCDDSGNIDSAKLDHLMPWSPELPDECRKPQK